MFASRFFISFLAFSALAVSASPAPVEKRSANVNDVLSVVSKLQSKTNAILPEIDALVAEGFANQATLTPLVTNLVASLNSAHTSLSTFNAVNTDSASASDVANAIAPIVSQITSTLSNAAVAVPGLDGILAGLGLDVAINSVIVGLDILIVGVVVLVSELLVVVANILTGLGLGLVLGTLGL